MNTTGLELEDLTDEDRSERPVYRQLVAFAHNRQGPNLDLNVHRYRAVALGTELGLYSSLTLAYREVEYLSKPDVYGFSWMQVAKPQSGSYVQDLVSGRFYELVAGVVA